MIVSFGRTNKQTHTRSVNAFNNNWTVDCQLVNRSKIVCNRYIFVFLSFSALSRRKYYESGVSCELVSIWIFMGDQLEYAHTVSPTHWLTDWLNGAETCLCACAWNMSASVEKQHINDDQNMRLACEDISHERIAQKHYEKNQQQIVDHAWFMFNMP